LVSLCSAHLCLINPVQRGFAGNSITVGINAPLAVDCALTMSACGGRDTPDPYINPANHYLKNTTISLFILKNEDHYTDKAISYIKISMFDRTTMAPLIAMPIIYEDLSATGPGIIYIPFTVPTPPTGALTDAYLQVEYHANDVDLVFYQCADVVIHV
jgi:hypothetical protein